MQKHVLDHPAPVRRGVVPAAVKAVRKTMPKRASLQLQQRTRDRAETPRLRAFLRIARGIRA